MASSRRPRPADAGTSRPAETGRPLVEADPVAALRRWLARPAADGPPPLAPDERVLIAFSGGLDSTVLLHAAVEALRDRTSQAGLLAVHVDHALQAPSADWARHCVAAAAALGIDCRVVRLSGAPRRGDSIEAWARQRRYQAFDAIAREVGARTLLTAHHADDQLETFLLRLARGAGLDGLSAMAPESIRGELRVLRPFLGLSRTVLEQWARSRQLAWIDDPSNSNEALQRNAVRRQLIPVIDEVLPGLRRRLPVTLAALREDGDRLREADRERLHGVVEPPRTAACAATGAATGASTGASTGAPGPALSLPGWLELPEASRAGVLRQWLALHGARMPSRIRLAEMIRQLEAPAADGIELRHDGFVLRRYRGQAMLVPQRSQSGASLSFTWHGERRIEIPERGGVLTIEPVEQPGLPGLEARWLLAPDLELRNRAGGERLRTHAGGPHRSLKKLYQERGIPAWTRASLPLLWAAGRPVWAAGIGCDADGLVTEGLRYALDWQPLDGVSR